MLALDFIVSWLGLGSVPVLDVLTAGGEARPEFKTAADEIKAKLNTEVTAEGFAETVKALPPEVLNILKGHLDPRDSPGLLG